MHGYRESANTKDVLGGGGEGNSYIKNEESARHGRRLEE